MRPAQHDDRPEPVTITDGPSAVKQTMLLVGKELDAWGRTGERARGDSITVTEIGVDGQGRTIIDVINLATREHWHLIVDPQPLARG